VDLPVNFFDYPGMRRGSPIEGTALRIEGGIWGFGHFNASRLIKVLYDICIEWEAQSFSSSREVASQGRGQPSQQSSED